MNAYIIIGDANSRKSSTIRALTGYGNGKDQKTDVNKVYDLATNKGIIDLFIMLSSLQEKNYTSKLFINEVIKSKASNVLFSLRIKRIKTRKNLVYPTWDVYVNDFINAGWNIKQIEFLGSSMPPIPQNLSSLKAIPATSIISTDPSNKIANQIRTRWGWL